jgi:hypothetical protein
MPPQQYVAGQSHIINFVCHHKKTHGKSNSSDEEFPRSTLPDPFSILHHFCNLVFQAAQAYTEDISFAISNMNALTSLTEISVSPGVQITLQRHQRSDQ